MVNFFLLSPVKLGGAAGDERSSANISFVMHLFTAGTLPNTSSTHGGGCQHVHLLHLYDGLEEEGAKGTVVCIWAAATAQRRKPRFLRQVFSQQRFASSTIPFCRGREPIRFTVALCGSKIHMCASAHCLKQLFQRRFTYSRDVTPASLVLAPFPCATTVF